MTWRLGACGSDCPARPARRRRDTGHGPGRHGPAAAGLGFPRPPQRLRAGAGAPCWPQLPRRRTGPAATAPAGSVSSSEKERGARAAPPRCRRAAAPGAASERRCWGSLGIAGAPKGSSWEEGVHHGAHQCCPEQPSAIPGCSRRLTSDLQCTAPLGFITFSSGISSGKV